MEILCKLCGDYKPIENFVKWKYSDIGYRKICKPCWNLYRQSNLIKREIADTKLKVDKVITCSVCGKDKNLSEFDNINGSGIGRRRVCIECKKERYWTSQLKQYDITPDDYNKMFEFQEGRCAICKRHQSEFSKRLHVDHDHDTKVVRSLLCTNCNTMLGLAKDDRQILLSACGYLLRNGK